jgi:hypothetical protein
VDGAIILKIKLVFNSSTVWGHLLDRKGFCINAFQKDTARWKEPPDGATLRAP